MTQHEQVQTLLADLRDKAKANARTGSQDERGAWAGMADELHKAICLNNAMKNQLVSTMQWIAYEAGQYADGAEDAHYLAKFLTEVEARAQNAIKSTQPV